MKHIKKAIKNFRLRHPDFPLWLSIVALIVSLTMPIMREFLAGMI